jgi:predicted enzyme related to lactoylglutathione lyase
LTAVDRQIATGARTMTETIRARAGTIMWTDLTVPNAADVRDFYSQVVGWHATPVDMGGYSDFCMGPADAPIAGVCHARGVNANVPAQWLIYITVEDLDRSVADCTRLGGRILDGPREMSGGRVCVIQDPAGAACALFQPLLPAA